MRSVLRDHVKIRIGLTGAGAKAISQRLLFVGREEGKLLAMRQLAAEVGSSVHTFGSARVSHSVCLAVTCTHTHRA